MLQELMDLEKNGEENRTLWVLNPPEPPCMLRKVLNNIKDTLLHPPNLNTFFSLNHQPWPKQVFAILQRLFPILASFQNYTAHKFKCDVLAGLILAIFAIPQSMGNATLAQLSPEYGLYTGIVPPLIYALLTSSREVVIGAVTVDSLLISAMVQTLKDPIHDSIGYTHFVLTATFFTGIFQVVFGLFRFGFLVDFLSHAAILGFLAAAAIGIVLQQLKGLFGINNFTNKTDLISVVKSLWTSFKNQPEWRPCNFIIGFSFLAFILVTRFLGGRKKKLLWLSHIAPLLSCIVSSVIAYRVNAHHQIKREDYKIEVLGPIKGGSLNPISLNQLQLDGTFLAPLIKIGFTVAVISTTEGIAVGRLFANLRGRNVDPNREVLSLGIMNIVGSFTSCFVATGSISRTAVNYNAGSETMVSSIVMALTVLMSLKFLTGLLYFTPKAILAAIILSAVPGLIDLKKVHEIWKVDKMDFLACAGAFFGVLFVSVEMGLTIGVMISFVKIIVISIQSGIAVVGRLPGTNAFVDVEQYPMAINTPGVLVVSIKSAWLCFANASLIRQRIEKLTIDEEAENGTRQSTFRGVILDTSSLVSIDTAGIASLAELNKNLTSHGVMLAIANPRWQVIHKLRLANFVSEIGGRVFLSVGEAEEAIFSAKMATL